MACSTCAQNEIKQRYSNIIHYSVNVCNFLAAAIVVSSSLWLLASQKNTFIHSYIALCLKGNTVNLLSSTCVYPRFSLRTTNAKLSCVSRMWYIEFHLFRVVIVVVIIVCSLSRVSVDYHKYTWSKVGLCPIREPRHLVGHRLRTNPVVHSTVATLS